LLIIVIGEEESNGLKFEVNAASVPVMFPRVYPNPLFEAVVHACELDEVHGPESHAVSAMVGELPFNPSA